MNTEQLRRKARELYNNKEVPQEVNQYNQRKWIRSVLKLGDKWLLAKNVERIQWLQDKTQSKIYRMVTTAVTVQSLKHLAHAVEKITSYLSRIYTMKTKKQWLKNI